MDQKHEVFLKRRWQMTWWGRQLVYLSLLQTQISLETCWNRHWWRNPLIRVTLLMIMTMMTLLGPLVAAQTEEVERYYIFLFRGTQVVMTVRVLGLKPLHLNISMHILHTALHAFLKKLRRRICLTINSFFSWWSFPLFPWPCVIQGCYNVRRN